MGLTSLHFGLVRANARDGACATQILFAASGITRLVLFECTVTACLGFARSFLVAIESTCVYLLGTIAIASDGFTDASPILRCSLAKLGEIPCCFVVRDGFFVSVQTFAALLVVLLQAGWLAIRGSTHRLGCGAKDGFFSFLIHGCAATD